MKKHSLILVLLLAHFYLFAQTADYEAAERYDTPILAKNIGTIEILPFFIKKSDTFWFTFEEKKSGRNYFLVNPTKKEKRLLYDKKLLAEKLGSLRNEKIDTLALNFMPNFSNDGKKLIFSYKSTKYTYDLYGHNLSKNIVKREEGKSKEPIIGNVSPDKEWQLYTRNHNLYLKKNGDTTETKLSNDGQLYYSFCINEFDTSSLRNIPSNAVWLPDSKNFYIIREDNRKVQTMSVVHTLSPKSWLETYKYQLPGDKDVTQYELWVGNVENKNFIKVDADKWTDQTISVVKGGAESKELFFLRKKRTLDEIELCASNLRTGKVRVIIHETNKPTINNVLFNVSILNKGKDIIWWSDKTGWGHYYLYDSIGNLKTPITSGKWTAGKVVFIDTTRRTIYFYGYGKETARNPYLAHLYKISFEGKKQKLLTPENANHKVFFSPSGNYFVDNYSRIDLEPKTVLRNKNGKFIMVVAEPDIQGLYDIGWRMPEPFKVKAKDSITDLYGIMWKPYNFDSTKVYPVISQVYPGPFTETVWPYFTVFDKYNNTSLAQVGFIVVCMGHRGGSPYRDKKYFSYGYGNLRDYPLEDDKYGLEQLAQQHKYIDLTRVGIFGHSGGGAMATAAICTYPDFYKVAVASSGNHDNTIYNRNWGESYQGITEVADTTKQGTIKYSFKFKVPVNQDLAKNLKGHLLLVTGEVDANVHPAHTYRMVDALIKAGKDFDMLVLPNQRHHYEGIYKTFFENKLRHYFGKYLIENKE